MQKKLEEYTRTQPEELDLFYTKPDERKYSRSIELYDAIPKYFWGKVERRDNRFIDNDDLLERTFQHRGEEYTVYIAPARIKGKNGISKDYLPGKREELVEDALRKLATEGRGVFLDNEVGVLFSLYELRQELKRMGHTYNNAQLKESILICNGVTLTVHHKGKSELLVGSPIFQSIGLQTQEDWKGQGKKSKAFVRFHPLITKSIQSRTFRHLNYEICMQYRSSLARWLHKRLSHNYRQASLRNVYTILLTTIVRDSGSIDKPIRKSLVDIKKALDEMISKEVLRKYEFERICNGRKLVDVKFTLFPHFSFTKEMKRSNKLRPDAQGDQQPRLL